MTTEIATVTVFAELRAENGMTYYEVGAVAVKARKVEVIERKR